MRSLPDLSRRGKRIDGLFRLMKDPLLWEQAYLRIAPNKGALTPGVDGNTLDGFSPRKVRSIIDRLADGTYRPQPVRRVYIPKTNGRKRPLGIPATEDRLVQEVVRNILEQIYEPVFSEHSHGFRPERSCHTALEHIQNGWTGVKWLVDVDVTGFFDNIDHDVLMGLLARRIADQRFLALIGGMLRAGYVEDGMRRPTYSGTPQGGVVSPLLANIYLHELDDFMERAIAGFDKGECRARYPEWTKLTLRISCHRRSVDRCRAAGRVEDEAAHMAEIRALTERRFAVPSGDPFDPGYRRLRYCRYADDFLIGVIGSKDDAKQVMRSVQVFLKERLKLDVSPEKSGIAKASDGTRFLGYDVCTYSPARRRMKTQQSGRRSIQRTSRDRLQLKVPRERVAAFCKRKGYGHFESFEARHRNILLHASDMEIVETYNAEIRGFANYYALAKDVKKKLSKLHRLWKLSLGATLASKHKSSISKVLNRMRMGTDYGVVYTVAGRPRCTMLWNLRDLKRIPRRWGRVDIEPFSGFSLASTDLLARLNAQVCSACGATDSPCEVHHVRKLAEMRASPLGTMLPASRLRKQIVLCRSCHRLIHSGKLPDIRNRQQAGMESRVR